MVRLSKEDLIPYSELPKELHKKYSSRGGKSVSPAKKFAAKVRELKKRVKSGQLKTGDEKWLLERIESRELMGIDMLDWIDEVRNGGDLHPSQRVALMNTYNAIAKTIHGEKIQNTNINVNMDIDEWEKRFFD